MTAAAFFDIDGTLLPPPSLERQFARFLSWRKGVRLAQKARWTARFLRLVWNDPLAATHGNKALYAGVHVSCLKAWIAAVRRQGFPFFLAGLEGLAWHASQGHPIFLVSGTLGPLARAVAAALEESLEQRWGLAVSVSAVATELEERQGSFTGRIVGAANCGPEKARALEKLAARHSLDLKSSVAYGNSFADRWMLSRVGHAVAVSPSLPLRVLAGRLGWPIRMWSPSASYRPSWRATIALRHGGL